jgi:hypothetical protein
MYTVKLRTKYAPIPRPAAITIRLFDNAKAQITPSKEKEASNISR